MGKDNNHGEVDWAQHLNVSASGGASASSCPHKAAKLVALLRFGSKEGEHDEGTQNS